MKYIKNSIIIIMNSEKQFKILICHKSRDLKLDHLIPKRRPFSKIQPFEKRAIKNHGQNLDTLNSRGGLSVEELYCVMHDLDLFKYFREKRDIKKAINFAISLVD